MREKISVAEWDKLEDRVPAYALVKNTDLVILRYDENVSVLYGRCHHRGALLADGHIDGQNLICGVHQWDYRYDTGISEYNNDEKLHKFASIIENGQVFIDKEEVRNFEKNSPVHVNRDEYLGAYEATHPAEEEPKTAEIHNLAKFGLSKDGHHGSITSMGVSSQELPKWDDIQILSAQLATFPHL